jgi:phenylalanyl-tRNA synthetase beta chain
MKVPVSWLLEYVALDEPLDALVDGLTFAGIEVEAVETLGGGLDGLVVGEVTRVVPHPNADRLRLCWVQTGTGETRVVCGAPNVEAGGKYPFAPVGVTLPNGLTLKKARIRGEVSEGMLCAPDELGLSDDHEGLLVLDPAAPAGTPLVEVLGPPETVLDLEITPNRPDCLCILGIARELAALRGAALKPPAVELVETGDPVEQLAAVEIRDPAGCPRYSARVLRNVKLGPSPAWMQRRLELAGVRPINNVVDITNYVMLETGHPLHAFDRALLEGGRIIVRRADAGEVMHTLDGVERRLEPDMLVIADARRPVAVAGVMGGAGSEIRDDTTDVLLESACFHPALIRSTARRLGLATESSYRFERGVNVDGVEWAGRRAAALMAAFAGAEVAPGVIDIYPSPPPRRRIHCRYPRLRALIGVEVPATDIVRRFQALELAVIASDDEGCTVEIPPIRGDLTREVDLIEEIARLHGLDHIPAPAPRAELVLGANDQAAQDTDALRDRLVGLGLHEILNYSTLSAAQLDPFDPDNTARHVALANPISQDHAVLRTSLLPHMVESLGRNHARQIPQAAFFEIGRTYHRDEPTGHREVERLAVGLLGPAGHTGLQSRRPVTPETMFFWIKGVWEALAHAQGLRDAVARPEDHPALAPGLAVSLWHHDACIGRLGILQPNIAATWRIAQPLGLCEVALHALLPSGSRTVQLTPVPPYPAIARDVALVVDATISHQQILAVAQNAAPKELESIQLFDIFQGEQIGEGKRSLAYSFSYRSADRTLTDEEANRFHDAVKGALRRELGAGIRDH